MAAEQATILACMATAGIADANRRDRISDDLFPNFEALYSTTTTELETTLTQHANNRVAAQRIVLPAMQRKGLKNMLLWFHDNRDVT